MWLLHTSTYKLCYFDGCRKAPEYAILSHTWGEAEVDFQQMQQFQVPKNEDALLHSPGLKKLEGFCHTAKRYSFEYVWIDACCIGKKSSAELDEAIRSMFNWYEKASICFVFLADVSSGATREQFCRSRWFKRGWTLQELIAPKELIFFVNTWETYGSISNDQLRKDVCAVTGIPTAVFRMKSGARALLTTYSTAEKMSWASERTTTRIEDEAYCLMGIFNVHMPVMYGEGRNAFYRLQKAILETSIDESIFVWKEQSKSALHLRGLLAHSPSEFKGMSGVEVRRSTDPAEGFKIDASGLKFPATLSLLRLTQFSKEMFELHYRMIGFNTNRNSKNVYTLLLKCEKSDGTLIGPMVFFLPEEGLYARVLPHLLFTLGGKPTQRNSERAIPVGSVSIADYLETPRIERTDELINRFRLGLDD